MKYRQRGYMESERGAPREKRPAPKGEQLGPRTPQMPGSQAVSRCGGCGVILPTGLDPNGKCPRCGFELHSCKQCVYFDPASRFECTQPIPARISKKDARNDCTFYSLRTTVERQTSPGASRPDDPRTAFERLFKK